MAARAAKLVLRAWCLVLGPSLVQGPSLVRCPWSELTRIAATLLLVVCVSTLDAAQPRRIVSLVPALTEMLFAIGAGPQVVGVGSFDTFPPEVSSLPRVGKADPVDDRAARHLFSFRRARGVSRYRPRARAAMGST